MGAVALSLSHRRRTKASEKKPIESRLVWRFRAMNDQELSKLAKTIIAYAIVISLAISAWYGFSV